MAASNEEVKERCMGIYREEKRKIKKCMYQIKKKINEEFGRKRNQDMHGNRKLFWKEVSKVESCSRINDGNGRLA